MVKPNIQLFKVKLKQKYQTELYLARKNATLDNFNQKWLFNPLALKFEGVFVAKYPLRNVMSSFFRILALSILLSLLFCGWVCIYVCVECF